MSRFAIRDARLEDAEGIAAAHVDSWQVSYRGILPSNVLDRIDVGQRLESRRDILRRHDAIHLVAYDLTHQDIVGFCDAGRSRRGRGDSREGEIYAIYLIHRAKRYGLGREMFEKVTERLAARGLTSLVIWVLDDNHHARRFYEALGGRVDDRIRSMVGGFPVIEQAYVWDRI
jgi:ribosomal protein S18 acetylase RimI-like enzyme